MVCTIIVKLLNGRESFLIIIRIQSEILNDIRGVLGNKCAGQHNLKMVYFREKLASASGGKLLCNDGGGDPLQALLEGALGQHAACQL